MKLLSRLRRKQNPPEESTFFTDEDVPTVGPSRHAPGSRPHPLRNLLSRLRPRRRKSVGPGEESGSDEAVNGPHDADELMGLTEDGLGADSLAADDELKDIMLTGARADSPHADGSHADGSHADGSDRSDAYRGRLLSGSEELPDTGDTAQKTEAQPIAFDNTASTIFEPTFRALLVAALVSLIAVAAFSAHHIQRAVSSETPAAQSETGEAGDDVAGAAEPSGRAGKLAEDFAGAYLAYDPGAGDPEQATEAYLDTLEPYLHPEADPLLFEPAFGEDSPATDVRYASTSKVERAAGEDRYRVSVNTQLQTSNKKGGEEAGVFERTLDVYVSAPADGGPASVIAPPRVTEQTAEASEQPGVFGYPDAGALEEPAMERTVEDFFDSLYGPEDARPLVEEEMAQGVSVERFPPEDHSYEGIERAAVYWRDDSDEAERQGYSRLYDLEVYVSTTDEATGVGRLDSWALTVGQREEGGYTITRVS